MGRSHLKILTEWQECERCQRRENRLNVFAPEWTFSAAGSVRIVLLAGLSLRTCQVAQCPEPALTEAAAEIEARLGLPSGAVVVDYLVACGLGPPTADSVAACSARFLTQARSTNVVLLGHDAAMLANDARLLSNGQFGVVGGPWNVPADAASTVNQAVAVLARRLPLTDAGLPARPLGNNLNLAADELFKLLGTHSGHRILRKGRSNWRTVKNRSLTRDQVLAHLQGPQHYSPYHPRGFWDFVVIDVDRHNSIQVSLLEDTLGKVRELFPNSIEVISSSTGGRHFYVKLPAGTLYEEAALVLQAYFAHEKLVWRDVGGRQQVRAQLIEVPVDPTRLPFGIGSRFPGDSRPITDQVLDLVGRIKCGNRRSKPAGGSR